jgi:DNA-binding CsgD family transcriptional regulator
MRVLLVGSPAQRSALRAQAGESIVVAGEFASLAAARASDVEADAILVGHEPGGGAIDLSRHGRNAASADESFDEPLTPREVQVIELLAEGLPNKAIAARLGISDQTVKFHLASIAGKLGAANRTDTVRRAVRRGLIDL